MVGRPQYSSQITLGSIITSGVGIVSMLVILVTVGMAWQQMKSRVEVNEEAVQALVRRDAAIDERAASYMEGDRIRSLELERRLQAQQEAMRREIDDQVQRLEGRLVERIDRLEAKKSNGAGSSSGR